MSDFAEAKSQPQQEAPKILTGTLYLQLTGESDPRYDKVKAIVNMFPGDQQVVLFFADTRTRRGTKASLDTRMLTELKNLLGESNVVVK
jgi:hypothetical protein